MTSPISRISFLPSPSNKDSNALKSDCSMFPDGTKKALIPIELSPKPQPVLQSPEVEITGATSFSLRQVELAKSTDDLYNSMVNTHFKQGMQPCTSNNKDVDKDDEYIVLSENGAADCVANDDLVILRAKNTLVLPLLVNRRFPVSNLDIRHFCAIVELAYTRGGQKSYAVMFSKVHCSYISLGQSLQSGGHMDNFLIPLFCRKLFKDNHPSKSLRHHFFSFIGENILEYNNHVQLDIISKALLGAASASKGKRLELSDMIKNFVKIWKIVFKTDDNIFKKFGVIYPFVPKQDNPDDCGVFTMKFMETFKPELDMRKVLTKMILYILEFSMQTSFISVQGTKLTNLRLQILHFEAR